MSNKASRGKLSISYCQSFRVGDFVGKEAQEGGVGKIAELSYYTTINKSMGLRGNLLLRASNYIR